MSQPIPARQGVATVNGAELHYDISGEGHPVVLVHAGVADRTMWDEQVPAFASRYTVIRYDARGFGKSPRVGGAFNFADDLYGLLQHLHIPQAHLVGCSLGGAACAELAAEHPGSVSALVLVGSGLPGLTSGEADPEAEALEQQMEAAEQARDFGRAADLTVRLWVAGPRRSPERVNPRLRERIREIDYRNMTKPGEEGTHRRKEPPVASRLTDITAPTLVLVGDEDLRDVQRAAEAFAQGIAGSRKVVIADAAHLPNLEHPALFNSLVLDFFSEVEGHD